MLYFKYGTNKKQWLVLMESKENILIIDYEEAEIIKLKTILGGVYNLDVVKTSTEAVNLVNSSKDKYSVIVVALNMPVLNGYLFCLSLKKDINIRNIPVIITGTHFDFKKEEPVEGLRIGEYDRLIKPFENKMVMDLIEINIEKKKMYERLESLEVIDSDTNLYTLAYFKEALDLEILKASKMETTFNCLTIKITEPEVRENLMSLIKTTCRYYDVISSHNDKILLLLPRTNEREAALIVNRFNTVIYGLSMDLHYYDPRVTDVFEFKNDILVQSFQKL